MHSGEGSTSNIWARNDIASPKVKKSGSLQGRSSGITMRVISGSSGTGKTSRMGTLWFRGSERRGSAERYCAISTSWGLIVFLTRFSATKLLSDSRVASKTSMS